MTITVNAISFDAKSYGLIKYDPVNLNMEQVTFWYKKSGEYIVSLSCGSILRVKDLEKAIDDESVKSLSRFGIK